MARAYAEGTSTSVDASRSEIERTLTRFGANQILYGKDTSSVPPTVIIGFRVHNRQVKMLLPLPARDSRDVLFSAAGRRRTAAAQEAAWEQLCRERWRVLAVAVKAKLAAVEAGLTTVEREFLADIVMPDGGTFGTWAAPQLERMYVSGQMPPLLPGLHTVEI